MTEEPKKSGYTTDAAGNKITGSEYQTTDDLMELRDSMEDHPEGLILGQILVEMSDMLAHPATTLKDVREVRTGEGFASFLLTDHEDPSSRITLDFPYGEGESQVPQNSTEPHKSLHARDLAGNRVAGGEYQSARRVAGGEYQSARNLMDLAEQFEDHPEGLSLGRVLTSISAFFENAGDVYKDVRDLQTGDDYASFLLTQHTGRTARITLTFEERR